MTSLVRIALDAGGPRLEVDTLADSACLRENGPYDISYDGDTVLYVADENGLMEHHIRTEEKGPGCGRGLRARNGAYHSLGRFSPVDVEIDLSDPEGFTIPLLPLHERPWPALRENDGCYDIGEQLILTLAERVNSLVDFTGTPVKDAIKLVQRGIPDILRRHMPRGRDTMTILLDQMAKLRLPLESH